MAVTAGGTPYVESSDLVANYPGVSLALAEHIDTIGGGKILQVVSVTKVNSFTTTSTSYTDVTGLTANITPTATTSKILVLTKLAINPFTNAIGWAQLLRGATVIGGGTAAGVRPSAMSSFFAQGNNGTGDLMGNYLDSPSTTSSLTYKIQVAVNTGTLGINTTFDDGNTTITPRTSSTITLMEVAA